MPLAQLMTVKELHSRLNEHNLVIVDCRFALDNPAYGQNCYAEGHIPKAHFADLEQVLSGTVEKGKTGRHPLPNPQNLLEKFQSFGIHSDSTVVLYDDGNAAFAARAWWLLMWLGKQQGVYLLNGGYRTWTQEGLGSSQEPPQPLELGTLSGAPNTQLNIETEALSQQLAELTLLDARSLVRFRGEQEPIDPVAGHIPGAYCLPCTDNIGSDGLFLSKEQLQQRFQKLLPQSLDTAKTVAYCGSGVTACQNLFALCLAGYPLFRLYSGSWSEWINDPKHPVATGQGTAHSV